MRCVAAPPLGTHRHHARSGAAITADAGHSASLVLFVYILHMAARCRADKALISLGRRGVRSGATAGRRKEDDIFAPPRHTSATKIQNFDPLLFVVHSSSFLPLCNRLLRGAITPTPKIKQKQLAGRLLAVLGFGKKGGCMVRWVGVEAKEGQACMK
jgi:hypothetical protein